MFIIYEFDDPKPCTHCHALGEVRLDLYDFDDVRLNRHRIIPCGYCEGYGYIETEIHFDADFSLQPSEPDDS